MYSVKKFYRTVIIANYFSLGFTFSDDHARSYITGVAVNNSPVDNYADGLSVVQDAFVSIEVDSSITDVDVSVNGTVQTPHPLFGSIQFNVTGETVVAVTTREPEPAATFSVNVDNAENVRVGYSKQTSIWAPPQETLFDLQDGDNTFDIPENVSYIFVKAAENCALDEVKVNGEVAANPNSIELTAGLAITVTSHKLVASASCTFVCSDYTRVALKIGETDYELTSNEEVIPFIPETQSVFTIEAKDPSYPISAVKHNDVDVPQSAWYHNYTVENVADGDRIEVTTPAVYDVTFVIAPEAAGYIDSVGLNDAPVFDYEAGFKAPEGAVVRIGVNTSVTGMEITVNGEKQTVDPLLGVMFTVTGPTTVNVGPVVDGIESISVDAAASMKLYDLKGVEVANPAAGIYVKVQNGKAVKVLVK